MGLAMLNTQEKIAELNKIVLFETLPPEALGLVAEKAAEIEMSREKMIFLEGEQGDGLYIIISGKVLIFKHQTILAEEGPSGFFGELALIDDAPRAASVKTLTDCKFLFIDKATFLVVMNRLPDLQRAALYVVLRYLRKSSSKNKQQ